LVQKKEESEAKLREKNLQERIKMQELSDKQTLA